MEEVLTAPWTGNQPASPHKLFNNFVKEMANHTLPDGREDILKEEPDPSYTKIPGFDWTKLLESRSYYFIGCHQVTLL